MSATPLDTSPPASAVSSTLPTTTATATTTQNTTSWDPPPPDVDPLSVVWHLFLRNISWTSFENNSLYNAVLNKAFGGAHAGAALIHDWEFFFTHNSTDGSLLPYVKLSVLGIEARNRIFALVDGAAVDDSSPFLVKVEEGHTVSNGKRSRPWSLRSEVACLRCGGVNDNVVVPATGQPLGQHTVASCPSAPSPSTQLGMTLARQKIATSPAPPQNQMVIALPYDYTQAKSEAAIRAAIAAKLGCPPEHIVSITSKRLQFTGAGRAKAAQQRQHQQQPMRHSTFGCHIFVHFRSAADALKLRLMSLGGQLDLFNDGGGNAAVMNRQLKVEGSASSSSSSSLGGAQQQQQQQQQQRSLGGVVPVMMQVSHQPPHHHHHHHQHWQTQSAYIAPQQTQTVPSPHQLQYHHHHFHHHQQQQQQQQVLHFQPMTFLHASSGASNSGGGGSGDGAPIPLQHLLFQQHQQHHQFHHQQQQQQQHPQGVQVFMPGSGGGGAGGPSDAAHRPAEAGDSNQQ